MSLLSALQWRYATKKFDSTKRLSPHSVDELMQAVNLAPSSFGLQPFHVFNVTDAGLREQIGGATMNPGQVNSASHLLVWAASTRVGPEMVSEFADRAAAIRRVPRESLAGRETLINSQLGKLDEIGRLAWAQRQLYLAMGVLVAAAAEAGIDACPMEGFDSASVDRILGLEAKGLRATTFTLLGHRASDDPFGPRGQGAQVPG
ncbi:nitroreductase family protein [Roseateles chitinivorans]|uniref:nitroreductase family protein n=1 Tax=Roseateles chitinivorans TaxID=2917965 RepID=UPI003D67EE9A